MATKGIENGPLSTLPHCQLTPPHARTLANIRTDVISPVYGVSIEHFRRWQYGCIFIRVQTKPLKNSTLIMVIVVR